MSVKNVFVVMLALLMLPFFAGAETVDVVTLKIGDGPDEVGASTPDKAVGDFVGPTAFTLAPDGSLYLLDAPKFCVKIFSREGKPVRSIPYPAKTAEGKPILGIDLAVGPGGDLFVANATQGLIWKFDAKGKLAATFGRTERGARLFGLLHRIAVDSRGNLLAGEGMSMTVLKLTGEGRKEALFPEAFYPPVVTPMDGLVMVKMHTRSKRVYVSFCSADQRQVKQVAVVEMEKPVLNASAVGYDARGHLYLFVVLGRFDDNYESAWVLELDKTGKALRRVQVPESPGIGMNRYLGVTPDSRILKVEADEKTFRIVEYR